jgi:hypothetical protein
LAQNVFQAFEPAARRIASSVTATAMGERLAITVAASLADLVVAARER